GLVLHMPEPQEALAEVVESAVPPEPGDQVDPGVGVAAVEADLGLVGEGVQEAPQPAPAALLSPFPPPPLQPPPQPLPPAGGPPPPAPRPAAAPTRRRAPGCRHRSGAPRLPPRRRCPPGPAPRPAPREPARDPGCARRPGCVRPLPAEGTPLPGWWPGAR